MTTGIVKVPSHIFKLVLERLGVSEVWCGRYGMKQPLLPDPYTALAAVGDVPSLRTAADLGDDGQARRLHLVVGASAK